MTYYRDKITGHLLEFLEFVDINTGVFKDLDEPFESRITAQFSEPWLAPMGARS